MINFSEHAIDYFIKKITSTKGLVINSFIEDTYWGFHPLTGDICNGFDKPEDALHRGGYETSASLVFETKEYSGYITDEPELALTIFRNDKRLPD